LGRWVSWARSRRWGEGRKEVRTAWCLFFFQGMNRKRVVFTYFVNANTFQDIMLSSTTAQLVCYSEKSIDQAKGFVRLGDGWMW
jgi:hypothetical protein